MEHKTLRNPSWKSTDIKRMCWFIPIILVFHNMEEALTMPQWMSVHLPMLREKIWLLEHLQFSTKQLYISLAQVTLIPLLFLFYCLKGELTERKIFAMVILLSIIFWNALMPHFSGLFFLGMYNPGAVTAVACNLPFTIYLLKKVHKERIISINMLRKGIIIGFAAYLPLVYLNHLIAEAISMIR